MAGDLDKVEAMDPGLFALTVLLRLRGIKADSDRICALSGTSKIRIPDILGCAKELGVDAQWRMAAWTDLSTAKLPAIVSDCDGNFLMVAEIGNDRVVVADQGSQGRREISRAEFETAWDGRLVEITARA